MKRVVWSVSAVDELTSIIAYISRNNPPAAERIAELLETAVLALAEYPVGRRGRVAGTFEKVLTDAPYIIAFAWATSRGKGKPLRSCGSSTGRVTGRRVAGRPIEFSFGLDAYTARRTDIPRTLPLRGNRPPGAVFRLA